MLDGLLGRTGFYSKCKSLIKHTRARIEVVRRKRNATQKFLRKDIADLLSNGLLSTAFSRTDGLIAELILTSCYDFIDHVCELVLKHLPVLQKLRDCPEDCRESVASLMFAAARFSDLPELCDLRDVLQEKYGSSLECYVNQKLVESITPKPPSTEKNVQLLQDIASEFSIMWDSRNFLERMSNSVTGQKQCHSPGTPYAAKSKVPAPPAEEVFQKHLKDEVFANKRIEVSYQNKERVVDSRHQMGLDTALGRRDDLKHNVSTMPGGTYDKKKSPFARVGTIPEPPAEEVSQKTLKDEVLANIEVSDQNKERVVDGRHQKGRDTALGRRDDLKHNVSTRSESTHDKNKSPSPREDTIPKPLYHDMSFQRRAQRADIRDLDKSTVKEAVLVGSSSRGTRLEPVDSQHKHHWKRHDNVLERDLPNASSQQKLDPQPVNNEINSQSPANNVFHEDIHIKSMRKRHKDATDGLKSNFRGGVPPPYSKPRKSKHKTEIDLRAEENDTLTFKPDTNGNMAEMLPTKTNCTDHQNAASASENGDEQGCFTEIYYKDVSSVELTPRRRSYRRKQSRHASTPDDKVNGEDMVVRQVSTNRRKQESRNGLQILVDDDDHHRKKDEEERMIDKLLLHYSKKPTSEDPGKSRKMNSVNNDTGKPPHYKAVDTTNVDEDDSTPTTSRSFSLPPLQVTEDKPEKVFTRAASFQQDTPAKHVHPKLPDYDDLAARFAALRAAKG